MRVNACKGLKIALLKPKQMKNTILIFPLLAFEWEKGIGRTITVGWLKYTYSITW